MSGFIPDCAGYFGYMSGKELKSAYVYIIFRYFHIWFILITMAK